MVSAAQKLPSLSRKPKHRAGGSSTALRSAPWQRRHRGSWASRFPTPPRLPGESRDPGTTELWAATKRTSNHYSLRGTEGAVFSRKPEHRAGGRPAAMRSAPWQRRHRGSWAPAFYPSSSRRTPGPRDHGALGGNQKDIEPLQPPRHRGCCLFKKARAPCRRKACCDEVRPVAAAPPWLLGPCFRRGNERRARGKRRNAQRKSEKREGVLI